MGHVSLTLDSCTWPNKRLKLMCPCHWGWLWDAQSVWLYVYFQAYDCPMMVKLKNHTKGCTSAWMPSLSLIFGEDQHKAWHEHRRGCQFACRVAETDLSKAASVGLPGRVLARYGTSALAAQLYAVVMLVFDGCSDCCHKCPCHSCMKLSILHS